LNTNIRTELPETNLIDTCSKEEGCIGVDFKYKSKKHLVIRVRYDGGENEYQFIERNGSTISKVFYSMD